MTSPLVTIVTPCYNRAAYLDETIQSVLDQDYPHIEYIVLDDGSTDNTREIVSKYSDRIIWESHPNMGETRTVNKGWRMASGDYIMTVNSDDPLLPGAIRTAVDFMRQHPDILVGYPDWNKIGARSEFIEHRQVPEYDQLLMWRRQYCFVGSGAIMRREVVEMVGGRDPQFKYVADFDFWLRLSLCGDFARIPKTLANFRVHPSSASVSDQGDPMVEEHLRLVEKLYSRPDLPPQVERVRAEAFAWANYEAGRYWVRDEKLTRELFLRALRHAPQSFFSIKTRRDLLSILSVVLPNWLFSILMQSWRVFRPMAVPIGWLIKRLRYRSV